MERSRNFQKLQNDSAETRNEARPADFVMSTNTARHVLNYSFQTGEEFAFEFMRDKAIPKRPYIPSASGHQIICSNYVDLRRRRAISNAGPGSESDTPSHASKEVEKKVFAETKNKDPLALTRTFSHASAGESSYRGFHPRFASSEPSPTRVKLLCSYGGKFLPRPIDGKLRYVGGDTRILRVSKGTSWTELMQRATTMYNKTHIIKYQLPGEDLDALVSVFGDEDLQHMIDECTAIEDNDLSQKPRMFLFSSDDNDMIHFTLGTIEGDSETQYVAAINGWEASGEASSRQCLESTSAGDLDQFLLLSVELERDKPSSTASETTGTYVAPEVGKSKTPTWSWSSPMQANLSSDFDVHPEYKDYRRHNAEVPHCAIHHREPFSSDENSIPIPSSMPSDYDYLTRSAPTSETSTKLVHKQIIPHWVGAEEFSGGILSQDQNVENKEVKPIVKGLGQKMVAAKENRPGQRFSSPVQQHGVSLSYLQLEALHETSTPTFVSPSKHQMNRLETQVSSPLDIVSAGRSCFPKEHGQPCTSTEEVTTECSDYKPVMTGLSSEDSHPRLSRVFYKDQMPLKQEEILVQLSNSKDLIGSQRPALDQCSSKKQELVEILDHLPEENLVFESDNLSTAAKQLMSSPTNTRSDVKEIQRRKALVPVIQMNQIGLVSAPQTPENSSYVHEPMSGNKSLTEHNVSNHEDSVVTLVSHLASNQIDNTRDRKTYEFPSTLEKSNRDYSASSLADEKNTLNKSRISNESDRSRSRESSSSDGKTFIPECCSQERPVDGSEATKPKSPPSSIGSILKQKEQPTLLSNKLGQEEITTKASKSDTAMRHTATHLSVDRNAGVVSRENCSLPATEHNDPLNCSTSQSLPDLVSNSFSKVRTSEESSILSASSKHDIIIGLNMPSSESQSCLVNLFHDEFASKDGTLKNQNQVHETHLHTDVERRESGQIQFVTLEDRVVFGQKNSQVDFSEVESSLANAGENLRTTLLEYEEYVSDKKEVDEPGPDGSMEVPNLRNVQIIKNEDLEELRELGSGTFGTVYHGKWRGTDVAIKRIKNSYFTDQSSQMDKMILGFWREVAILSKLHHPNVVAFYGVVKDEPGGTLATVTEFMAHGSLKHVLQRKDKYLDFRKRLLIAMDAAIGMEYLHSRNVVHFDLKCDNLLVSLKDQSRPICKVCDFGLSKMKPNTMVSGGVRGTLPWMAPELLYTSSNKVSEKIDVYSFGIVMWEILTGEEPYADMHYGEVIGGLLHNTLRPPVPVSCDKDWRNLMEQCWAADPNQRPTFTQIASCLYSMYRASQIRASN